MPLVFHLILALGVLHACVLMTWLAWKRRENTVGHTALIAAVFAVTLIMIEEWVVASGQWIRFPHILRVSAWMPLLIGPSLWIFARSLERPDFKAGYLLHILPALIAALLYVPFYLQSGDAKVQQVLNTSSISLFISTMGLVKVFSLVGYLIGVFALLRQINQRTGGRPLLRASMAIVIAILLFTFAVAAAFSVEHVVDRLPISSDLAAALGLGILIYLLSFFVVSQWSAFAKAPGRSPADQDASRSDRTELLDLDSSQAVFTHVQTQVMDKKLFKISQLKLGQLSSIVGVAPHYLSFVINQESGSNFNDWLNRLRIDAVKLDLIERADASVLEIALDNGFNSKASFHRAFAKACGMSPSEFRKTKSQIAK